MTYRQSFVAKINSSFVLAVRISKHFCDRTESVDYKVLDFAQISRNEPHSARQFTVDKKWQATASSVDFRNDNVGLVNEFSQLSCSD